MPPARYAAETEVSADKSKFQIAELLRSRKVEAYHTGWDQSRDIIEFQWQGKQIRFVLEKPVIDGYRRNPRGGLRSPTEAQRAMEQADRQRWRALYLVIRAKIEAIEAQIAIFEEEFMAFIVVPGQNKTIGEIMVPRIQAGGFDMSRALGAGDGEEE